MIKYQHPFCRLWFVDDDPDYPLGWVEENLGAQNICIHNCEISVLDCPFFLKKLRSDLRILEGA